MTDTIQRRRNTEGYRVSDNVGIAGESDFENCSLKGKTAPSLSALFVPLGLGLNGYHRLHFFFQPFWYDVFPLSTVVFLEESFRSLIIRKTGKHGRDYLYPIIEKVTPKREWQQVRLACERYLASSSASKMDG